MVWGAQTTHFAHARPLSLDLDGKRSRSRALLTPVPLLPAYMLVLVQKLSGESRR